MLESHKLLNSIYLKFSSNFTLAIKRALSKGKEGIKGQIFKIFLKSTWESQSNPGIETWLEALEPFVTATVVDMEQVSWSHDGLIPSASFLLSVSWEAAAATNASVDKRKKNFFVGNHWKS